MKQFIAFLDNLRYGTATLVREPKSEKIIVITAPDIETAENAFKQAIANINGLNNYECVVDAGLMHGFNLSVDTRHSYGLPNENCTIYPYSTII